MATWRSKRNSCTSLNNEKLFRLAQKKIIWDRTLCKQINEAIERYWDLITAN